MPCTFYEWISILVFIYIYIQSWYLLRAMPGSQLLQVPCTFCEWISILVYIYTSGYPRPSNTVKSPGFFKPDSCLSFFVETFILQDYRSFSSSSSIIFFFRDEELGWMDDGTDEWKGRPPPDRLRILYIKI